MRYATPAAFRTALERRILDAAVRAGVPVAYLRKRVVFDRLLARLLVAAPDRWILKGALALDLRLAERSRSTKDMDLAHRDDEKMATADFVAAESVDLGDYFTFAIERTAKLDAALEGAAVRYHAVAATGEGTNRTAPTTRVPARRVSGSAQAGGRLPYRSVFGRQLLLSQPGTRSARPTGRDAD